MSGYCVIIDNQNCENDEIIKISAKFKKFKIQNYRNLLKPDMEELLRNVFSCQDDNLACIVVCVLATFTNETISGKGIICRNNVSLCIQDLVNLYSNNISFTKKIPIYLLINDRKRETISDENQFHLLYQTSNVYLSFNTYQDSWFVHRLCASLGYFDKESECNVNEKDISFQAISKLCAAFSTQLQLTNHDKDVAQTIFTVSTNAIEQTEHVVTENPKAAFYDCEFQNKGICIIIDFNLNLDKMKNLTKRENSSTSKDLLAKAFQTLGFEVFAISGHIVLENGKQNKIIEMEKIIKHCVSKFDHSLNNCFMMCLITHCDKGELLMDPDDETKKLPLQKLFRKFNPSLTSKPKFLLIHDPYEVKTMQNIKSSDDLKYFSSIPKHSLIVYSKYENGTISDNPNNVGTATYFIETFCQMVENYHSTCDLFIVLKLASFIIKQNNSKLHNNSDQIQPNVLIKSTLSSLFYVKNHSNSIPPINEKLTSFLDFSTKQYKYLRNFNIFTSWYYRVRKVKCLLLSFTNENETSSKVSPYEMLILKSTLEELKFDIDELVDQPIKRWKSDLRKKSQDYFGDYDCLVVIVFPNQSPNAIVERKELFNFFTDDSSLMEKPKLFFVLGEKFKTPISDNKQEEDRTEPPKKIMKISIPVYSNFLYFYCSNVSQALQSLCSELQPNSLHNDLNSVLSNVILKSKQTHQTVCYLNSTLTQLVSFKSRIEDEEKIFLPNISKTINSDKYGVCFIFDMNQFKDNQGNIMDSKTRHGSKYDVEELEFFFGVELNFMIITKRNLTTEAIKNELEKIEEDDFSSYGCFVMCYLSHGGYDGTLRTHSYEQEINRDDLIKAAGSNSTLDSTPKLFFIQACQGGLNNEGIFRTAEFETDSDDKDNYENSETSKWNFSDLFVFTGSYPDYVSYRYSKEHAKELKLNGSIFIQTLCEILQDHYYEYDLVTIASAVCKKVSYFGKTTVKGVTFTNIQVPYLYSTLTKPIILAEMNKKPP